MTNAAYLAASGDASFSRASVRTGWTGLSTWDTTAIADQPVIGGRGRWWGVGRIHEGSATNRIADSRNMSTGASWTNAGNATITNGAGTAVVAADGAVNTAERIQTALGQYSSGWGPGTGSAIGWTSNVFMGNGASYLVPCYHQFPLFQKHLQHVSQVWQRFSSPVVSGSQGYDYPVEGFDESDSLGAMGPFDVIHDQADNTISEGPCEPIITTGSTATCAGESVTRAAADVVSNGCISLYFAIAVKHPFVNISVSRYLLARTGDSANHAIFIDTSLKINVIVGGVTVIIPGQLDSRITREDYLELRVDAGAGQRTAGWYRINLGDWVFLGYGATLGNWDATGTYDILGKGTASQVFCWELQRQFFRFPSSKSVSNPVPAGHVSTTVSSDLTSPDWRIDGDASATTVQPYTVSGSVISTSIINPFSDAPRTGSPLGDRNAHRFVAPDGTTNTTFSIGMQLPVTAAASTVLLAIYNADESSLLASSQAELTSSPATYSVSYATTPGTNYRVDIATNQPTVGAGSTHQAQAIVTTPPAVTHASATGVFAASYTRFPVKRTLLSDCSRISWTSTAALGPTTNNGARMVFTTDSTSMAVEYWSSMIGYTPAQVAITVYVTVSGVRTVASTLAPAGTGTIYMAAIALPAGLGKTVEVVMSPDESNGGGVPFNVQQTCARAVYFPAGTNTVIVPDNPALRRLIILGTSIGSGFNATSVAQKGWTTLARYGLSGVPAYPGAVINDAVGAKAIDDDGDTTGQIDSMIAQWSNVPPFDVVIECFSNDWARPTKSAADMGPILGTMCDRIHAAFPSANLWLLTALTRANEADTNTFGDALPAYRAQVATVQSTRTGFCTLINGPAMVPLGVGNFDPDGIHLTDAGNITFANGLHAAGVW